MNRFAAWIAWLERKIRFQDWPLVWKFAAAPASMLALFLISVTLSMAALVYAQRGTDRVVGHDMADIATLSDVTTHFEHANGEMYRLLADKAASVPGVAAALSASRRYISPLACSNRAVTSLNVAISAISYPTTRSVPCCA